MPREQAAIVMTVNINTGNSKKHIIAPTKDTTTIDIFYLSVGLYSVNLGCDGEIQNSVTLSKTNTMKKFLVIIAIILFSPKLIGQDPALLENDWYLEKIIMDSEEYERPYPNFQAILNANTEILIIDHSTCEEGFGSMIQYVGTNIFTIDDSSVVLIGVCGDPDINAFMQFHYQIYLEDNNFAKNPFTYTIENTGSYKTLTVINGDGDVAIYGDQLLNAETFTAPAFKVYPNPTTDYLFIKSQGDLSAYQLYDLNGRKVQKSNLSGTETRMDLSKLPSGLYFLRLYSEETSYTYKIVKE